jgi:2-amino-4-hydroxy-6-hydroxymethyldihydropteridine diphosphokinase
MTAVYIALGSNLGDRAMNLEAAIAALSPAVRVIGRSAVYETDPKYITEQPAFLNMVVCGDTGLKPEALLKYVKVIERELGRTPAPRYGPRLIDLDIIFFGDRVIDSAGLSIPHPRMAEREFVLKPLCDLAPDMRHPLTGDTMRNLLEKLGGGREIRPYPYSITH